LLQQYADTRKMMKSLSGGFMGKKLGKMKLPGGFPFDIPGMGK
jgi:signal recognition particle subunit SRP54